MFIRVNIFFIAIFISGNLFSQNSINWLTWEEALELNTQMKKKFFVNIYTDWCQYCEKLEKSTLSDPYITEYINQNYYSIHFNAEDKSDIVFKNKTYKPIKSFGKRATHELAIEIMNGNIGYPTVVFIDENLKVIQPLQGFHDINTFKMIMTYFAMDYYKSMPWKFFVKDYNATNIETKQINPKDIQPPVQTVGNG